MTTTADLRGVGPIYVVYRVEQLPGQLYAVFVQMPDQSTAVILVPEGGLSFTRIRLAAEVVAQLWETKRGATPVGEG